MTSSLQRQAAAFRQKHSIPEGLTQRRKQPAPSVLFSPEEAKTHDAEDIAALARQGLVSLATLDPDAAGFASLFQGQAQDRNMLTAAENEGLNKQIRRLLLVLSPHLMTRSAQECLEGLLHHYHVHRWNVDDVIACALPYHDSSLFTRLLQGLHVAGKPRWAWLQPLKEKPTTLVRPALAKYCAKDLSVLSFIGEVLQETSTLQKTNKALSTLYCALWLDTLASTVTPSPDLVITAVPPMLGALRRPHQRDAYLAAMAVGGTLCVKAELESSMKIQMLERMAKHSGGALGTTVLSFLVLVLQLQPAEQFAQKALQGFFEAGSR
jgi:U3 small nucleolar RNA-associated protein 10